MPKNYQLNRVFATMKRGDAVGHSLGLVRKQEVVKGIMEKQKILVDPSKLAGFKKEKFLKAIKEETNLGYYDKMAFQSAYGAKKAEVAKTKIVSEKKAIDKQGIYDEIMSKRSIGSQGNVENVKFKENKSKVLDLSAGNNGFRRAESLFHGEHSQSYNQNQIHTTSNNNKSVSASVQERLRNIQSRSSN